MRDFSNGDSSSVVGGSADRIKDIGLRSGNIYKDYVDEDLKAHRDET